MDNKNLKGSSFDEIKVDELNDYKDTEEFDTDNVNDVTIGQSAPWVIYVNSLKALFAEDKKVHIQYSDEDPYCVKIFADTVSKAYALEHSLPSGVAFGNVTLKIDIIPANAQDNPATLLAMLFEDNPIVDDIIEVQLEGITYVSFRNEVIQFWGDNLGDPHGNISTLAEFIAPEVFSDMDGVCFCTSPKNPTNE